MALPRLTNSHRDDIRMNILRFKFEKECDAIHLRFRTIAEQVYLHFYPASVRRRMNSLPEGWLPFSDNIDVNLGGQKHSLYFIGPHRRWGGSISWEKFFSSATEKKMKKEINKRFPTHKCGSYHVLDPKSDLGKDLSNLIADSEQLSDRIKQLSREIRATLSSISTVKKLLEAWPEISDHVPNDLKQDTPAGTAVALPIDRLNHKLGFTA